jgi:hypothetical protein
MLEVCVSDLDRSLSPPLSSSGMHPAGVTLLALGADTASCLARLAATRPSRFANNAVASAISGNVDRGPASLNSGQLERGCSS